MRCRNGRPSDVQNPAVTKATNSRKQEVNDEVLGDVYAKMQPTVVTRRNSVLQQGYHNKRGCHVPHLRSYPKSRSQEGRKGTPETRLFARGRNALVDGVSKPDLNFEFEVQPLVQHGMRENLHSLRNSSCRRVLCNFARFLYSR